MLRVASCLAGALMSVGCARGCAGDRRAEEKPRPSAEVDLEAEDGGVAELGLDEEDEPRDEDPVERVAGRDLPVDGGVPPWDAGVPLARAPKQEDFDPPPQRG